MDCQVPILKQDYKVLVRCFTFNQSKYIKDALNGFVMQETDFPFVCAIVDDCSTDGEQDVIKSYLDTEFNMESAELYETDYANIIVAVHKTNINCSFAVFLLKYNHYSLRKPKGPYLKSLRDVCPYEALCEGDDYWIDKRKLQRQFDLINENSNCTLCYHACENLFEEGYEGWKNASGAEVAETYTFDDLLKRYNFQYGTVLYRASVLNSSLYKDLHSCGFVVGDLPVYLAAAHLGKLCGIPEIMSVYRRQNNGISLKIYKGEQTYPMLKAYLKSLPLFSREEQNSIIRRRLKNMKFWRQMSFSESISLYSCILLQKPIIAIELVFCFAKYIIGSILKISKRAD